MNLELKSAAHYLEAGIPANTLTWFDADLTVSLAKFNILDKIYLSVLWRKCRPLKSEKNEIY